MVRFTLFGSLSTALLVGNAALLQACSSNAPRADETLGGSTSPDGGAVTNGNPDGGGSLGDASLPMFRGDLRTSGTRLVSYVVKTAAGGSYKTRRFLDSKLQTDCSFALAKDGSVRCLPSLHVNATYFADPNCSKPLMRADEPEQQLVRPSVELAGCGGQALFRKGTQKVVGKSFASVVNETGGLSCVEQTLPIELVSAEEVDYKEYVEAQEKMIPINDSLAALVLSGADGSLDVFPLYDRNRGGAFCWFDATGVCVPAETAETSPGLFADATCSMPLAKKPTPLGFTKTHCALPIAAVHDRGKYYEATMGPSSAFSNAAGACQPSASFAKEAFVQRGALLDPAKFPKADRALEGGGNVKVERLKDGSQVISERGLFDTRSNSACSPSMTSQGLRCVSSVYFESDARVEFADAACSVPVASVASGQQKPSAALGARFGTKERDPVDVGTILAYPSALYAAGMTFGPDGKPTPKCISISAEPSRVYFSATYNTTQEPVSVSPER